MEEAAKRKIAVVVLDRPNPVNGWQIEGPNLDAASDALITYHPMPVRHGMTIGELARLFNDERKIGADLTVVPAENWRRDHWFDETGLTWINPSPNMRNLNQATLYPGIGAIEYSNISVGRGTDQPFEQLGAPWIDGPRLAAALNARRLPGIRFYPVTFTPSSSKYAGQECQGVFMVITNRAALQPVRVGLEVAAALSTLFGDQYQHGEHRSPARIARELRAREARRGSRGGRRHMVRGGRALAAVQGEVFLYRLPLSSALFGDTSRGPPDRSTARMSRSPAAPRRSRCSGPRRPADLDDGRVEKGLANQLGLFPGLGLAGREQHQEFIAAPAKHVVGLRGPRPQDGAERLRAPGRRCGGRACR